MAQAQIDVSVTHKQRQQHNTFHIPLDHEHSITICRRMHKVTIGVYKNGTRGKRRACAVPLSVWYKMTTSHKDMIDLAINLVEGTDVCSFNAEELTETDLSHGQHTV